jgi:hypothetical protein
VVVRMVEIGLMTPAVDLNVYVLKGAAGNVSIADIFRDCAWFGWFVFVDIINAALLLAFAQSILPDHDRRRPAVPRTTCEARLSEAVLAARARVSQSHSTTVTKSSARRPGVRPRGAGAPSANALTTAEPRSLRA